MGFSPRTDSEYRTYSVMAAVQSASVVAGLMILATVLRVFGYGTEEAGSYCNYWPVAVFFRHWGLLVLFVPMAWVIGSISYERSRPGFDLGPYRLISGYLILGLICLLFAILIFGAVRFPPIHIQRLD